MAARVLLLSILFTEVLQSARTAGIERVRGSANDSNLFRKHESEIILGKRVEPLLTIQPSGHVILGKKDITLTCLVGNGEDVTWLHNGIPAPPCGMAHCALLRNGSLHFLKKKTLQSMQKYKEKQNIALTSIKYASPDEYRCIAKTNFGESLRSSPAIVQIAELAHIFKESPQDIIVFEGEIARLSCQIDSVPFPPNITWQHNGETVSFNRNNSKYSVIPSGVLYISATKISDSGSYRCTVTNEFLKKTRRSREAKLTVVPRPSGRDSHVPASLYPQISYNHSLNNGSDLDLACAASGYPPPLITWTFISRYADSIEIPQPRVLLNSTIGIGILLLRDMTISEAGLYICSVRDIVTMEIQVQNITVDILVPPSFLKKPSNQVCPNGRTARFECQAQGLPVPQIYWLKDSMNITINGRRSTYRKEFNKIELAISATVPSDSGIYQCVAVNSAGEIWAAGRLQVNMSRNSPAAPTSLKCHPLSPVKIFISWEPPKSLPYTSITAYTVHYSPVEGGREEVSPPEPGNSTSVEVTKLLEPFTNYSFYVRVWNNHGASDQSEAIGCSTAPSVPKSAPKIKVDVMSSTNLNVTWEPLSKREARGIVIEYKLQWRLHRHPSARVLYLPASIEWYILSDLVPGGQYDVRVLARTKQGWPNIGEAQFAWTSIKMPSPMTNRFAIGDIIHLEIFIVNVTVVKVTWELSSRDDVKTELEFDSWQVYCESQEGEKIDFTLLPRNVTQYLFTHLESNLSYTMQLCMMKSKEAAGCLSKHIETARSVFGNVPMALEAIPVSSTAVNVTWTVNDSRGALSFELCYYAVHATNSTDSNCIFVEDTSATIDNLKPFTLYQFKIRAIVNDSFRNDDYDESVECYTHEDVPDKVEEIQWFLGNNTKVRVAWKEPRKVNGIVQGYLVTYTTNLEDSPETWANVTVPGNKTSTTLPGLLPGRQYFVVVQASTRAGYGKPSEPIIIITGGSAVKVPTSSGEQKPPRRNKPDQSLGVILGVGISIVFITICLCSMYCRRKCENSRSPGNHAQPIKSRSTLVRNGNGCCTDQSSTSLNQQSAVGVAVHNEIEMAVLCPMTPVATNPQSDAKGGHSNGIPRSCVKEPLLDPWETNSESKDVSMMENLQASL